MAQTKILVSVFYWTRADISDEWAMVFIQDSLSNSHRHGVLENPLCNCVCYASHSFWFRVLNNNSSELFWIITSLRSKRKHALYVVQNEIQKMLALLSNAQFLSPFFIISRLADESYDRIRFPSAFCNRNETLFFFQVNQIKNTNLQGLANARRKIISDSTPLSCAASTQNTKLPFKRYTCGNMGSTANTSKCADKKPRIRYKRGGSSEREALANFAKRP